MAMTYSQFKSFLLRTLWRDGDTVLDSDLDNLIDMAHARLNRDLRVDDMLVITTSDVEGEQHALPTDFLEMRTIVATDLSQAMAYVSPHELYKAQLSDPTTMQPIYSVAGSSLLFAGPMTAANPEPVKMLYYESIPNFAAADTSWLADKYLDVYTYAVLSQTGPYLREDGRVQMWAVLYQQALDAAMVAQTSRKYAGSPLKAAMPAGVA